MSSSVKILLVISLLCVGVAAGFAIGTYLSVPFENEMAGNSCPLVMAEIIQSAKGDVYNMEGDSDYVEPESHYLVIYSVQGDVVSNPMFESVPNDLKDDQINSSVQNEAWKIFTDLIPPQDRRMLAQYKVFTDGYSNTLAAVDQTRDDPSSWILEIDIADLEDKDALMFTLIHEYAHLLTLNASQVTPDQEIVDDPFSRSLQKEKAGACPNFFTGTGCSHSDSYIQEFYNLFWVDLNDEWQKLNVLQYEDDLNPYYEGLYHFYLTHQDQFFDDYATTHPTEDIAESFAYFVFSPKPSGTSIKEQKILFFYNDPYLIELRKSILKGTCSIVQ